MKVYQHIIIIVGLILFTIFFYQDGFGAIAFLLATIYLTYDFFREINVPKTIRKRKAYCAFFQQKCVWYNHLDNV